MRKFFKKLTFLTALLILLIPPQSFGRTVSVGQTPANTIGTPTIYLDDIALNFGTGSTSTLLWETADANANVLLLALPNGGATDVPVFVIGDAGALNVDLGFFNGLTAPSFCVLNATEAFYSCIRHDGTDFVFDTNTGHIKPTVNLEFSTGNAITAGDYEIGRDADGTNQLHFNVPTGASFEKSINNVGVEIQSANSIAWKESTGSRGITLTFAASNGQQLYTSAGNLSLGVAATDIVTITSASLNPASAGGATLGTGTIPWSNLFLKSGGVLNFNNSDVTATHTANTLTFAGASSGYAFDSTITSSNSTTIGWSVVASANQACSTTCNNACVFGVDTAAGASLLDCSDGTSDRCVCAGSN